MIRLYLDTSVISAVFDDENPERQSLTRDFFVISPNFQVFVSDFTLQEIAETSNLPLRNQMEQLIAPLSILPLTEDVEFLANEYLNAGAFRERNLGDAFHVAIASINQIDYLLSWNFKHLVRLKTRTIVNMVNTLNNYTQVEIITPAEFL
ncbi:MAG TPA: PIN domain-containing protein [Candidatus Lokiarchaeia archaeon]|nr:PIN domain-containing protein [Candidatus Lokiarchaeia archaeon]